MLPTIFTEKAPKTIVSCEASSKFHSTSSQNERFARCFRQFSQKQLPKRSFRARLPRNFKEQASKKIVSCEASSKFHRTSSQNERFARCLRQFSQKKLSKWSFRTRLPPNLTEQASKTSFSCEASSKFHRTILPKRTFRAMLPTISIENLRFATVSCHRPTESYERVHPAKAKCASRYNGVPFHISKSTFYYSGVRKNVWIQRRKPGATRGIQKSPFYHSFGHLTSTKWRSRNPLWARNDERVARRPRPIRISPQFWTSDEHEVTRGLRRRASKFAFHLSFGRPISTKRREGCATSFKIRISPQFWTSDEHETTRGLRDDVQNSHFTTVLDVRWARSDERVVSRLDRPNPPCVKKERNFKEVLIHNHSQQIFSADFFSRSSQQIFSADFLQQIFSADLLSRFSQQIFSADLLSRSSQQIFSADLLSRFSSADLLSRFSQQIFSADLLSRSSHCLIICCGQGLVVSYCLIILIICCGQGLVVSYCLIICCGQGLVVSYCLIMLVVYVGGLYCMSSLEGPFRGAFGKT